MQQNPHAVKNSELIISLQVKYEGYLKRQLAEIEKFEKVEHSRISEEINYMEIESIAYEARERLSKIKPVSLGQAARISGVNQTDINALMVYLKKNELKKMPASAKKRN